MRLKIYKYFHMEKTCWDFGNRKNILSSSSTLRSVFKISNYTCKIFQGLKQNIFRFSLFKTRSGSVLTGLIPPAATNSSFSKSRSKSRSRSQGQIFWYQEKGVATKNTYNMKAPSLLVKKLCLRLSFFKSKSKVKVKVMRSKFLVRRERSCPKEHTCVIWKPNLF